MSRADRVKELEVSVPAAFLGVVLIWGTTPLAIQWSTQGPGFLFGVAARMVLGVLVCLALALFLDRRLGGHRSAVQTYLAGGIGLWGAMTSVYWAAQFIPSGLISVVLSVVIHSASAVWVKRPPSSRPTGSFPAAPTGHQAPGQ